MTERTEEEKMKQKDGSRVMKKILLENKERNPFLCMVLFDGPVVEFGVYDFFDDKILRTKYSDGESLKLREHRWKEIEAFGSMSKEEVAGILEGSEEIPKALLYFLKAKRK